MGGGEWSSKCAYPAGKGLVMSKRRSDHDDGGVEYRETYDEKGEVKKVLDRARAYAKDRGEAFVVFLGAMLSPGQNLQPYRAYKTKADAQETARELVGGCWGYPRASVKIRRVKV